MKTQTLNSLDEILRQLTARHFPGNTLALAPLCTRVMLRTGANLRSPKPEHQQDPAVVAKVLAALAEMGYPL